MKQLFRMFCISCIAFIMVLASIPSTYAATVTFTDVSTNFWARSAIEWGVQNNIITGYTDKTFRPNNNVTEAEFLAMYIRAFDVTPAVKELKHWADPAYAYAVGKNWPVLGYNSTTNRNKAVTRGFVAQIIASSQGLNLDETSSVQFLLNENLSAGKTSATVAGYQPNDKITRAETVVFIKRLRDAGIKKLDSRPVLGSEPIVETPKADVTPRVQKVEEAVTKLIESSSTYKNVSTKSGNDSMLVFGIGSEVYVSYEDNVTPGTSAYDLVRISKATDKAARDIAYKILETLGVKITPEIKKAIEDAPNLSADEVKDIRIQNTNVDISIRPSKFDQDTINISVKVK